MPAIKRKWEYATWKDKALSTTVTAVALGGYGWCLSQVFNPIALGLAGTWAAYKLTKDVFHPAFSESQRQKSIQEDVEKGNLIPTENYRNIETIVKELSAEMGLSYTPPVYFLGEEKAAQFIVQNWNPLGRWCYEALPPEARREENKRLTKNFDNFMADSACNAIYTTPGSVDKTGNEELRWVLGHEIAHLKNRDGIRISKIGRYGIEKMNKALFFTAMPFEPMLAVLYGGSALIKASVRKGVFSKIDSMMNHMTDIPDKIGNYVFKKSQNKFVAYTAAITTFSVAAAAGVTAIGVPLMAGLATAAKLGWITSSLALTGATLALLPSLIKKILNIDSRHIEKRADRNSLYHTRNPAIDQSCIPLKPPVLSEMSPKERFNYHAEWKLSTHPGPIERRAALMEAWEQMGEYEGLPMKKPVSPPPTVMDKIPETLRI